MNESPVDSLRLQTDQRQEILLSPELRASLKILQMDRLSLVKTIQQEADNNPVIESDPPDDDTALSEVLRTEETAETPEEFDDPNGSVAGIGPDEAAAERRQRFFDRQVAEETLLDHLVAQIPFAGFSSNERDIAEFLVSDIDDDGRYVGSFDDLNAILGTNDGILESVLSRIQQFDPPGVAARNLRECLHIQAMLKPLRPDLQKVLLRLIDGHLEDVASFSAAYLARKLQVSVSFVEEALSVLRTFEPRPGRPFSIRGKAPQFIQVEVLAVPLENGSCAIEVLDRGIPKVRVNAAYQKMFEDHSAPSETISYLRERIRSAKWLIDAISRRQETIRLIAEEIFKVQNEFFSRGFDGLKPLTIEEIARRTHVHGTTVGRAVRGKYVQTPRGIFELKDFFCVGKLNRTGTLVSAISVKRQIAALINEEDADSPLDDAAIATRLSKDGLLISRRTVAKYRTAQGIPIASVRRRQG